MVDKASALIRSNVICPIFLVSSLSGQGINTLTHFLFKLKSRQHEIISIGKHTDPVEFDIHDKFLVSGTGLVVSGLLKSGTLKEGGQYIVGPDKNNQYK